ncbi:MAG: hypothetical protein OXK76_01655 [Gammaproteobacteria bacterium]|nr:hypothetical protein [Gammaproteobacteria bacterium]
MTAPRVGFALGPVLCVVAGLACSGCVQTTVQGVRQAETQIDHGESIVILSRKHKTQGETEDDFVTCVSDSVNTGSRALPILSESEFVDAMFPWFEPRTAPLNMDDLATVIGRPIISRRIDEIGVRYLVWIEGTTERSDESGSLNCTFFSGGIPACFGFLSWESGSNYEASVWDVERGMSVGTLSSEAAGTSFVPAVIVPIPVIARVREKACANMSDQIKTFINPDLPSVSPAAS